MAKIIVKESEITVLSMNENDYISLTDIAKHKSDESFIVICNWLRNRNTIEYLGIWETLFNPDFKPIEFDRFKNEAGLNAFTLSPQKWINASINELICLSNMESMNSVLIEEGLPQSDRLVRLNEMAIRQMEILSGSGTHNLLK